MTESMETLLTRAKDGVLFQLTAGDGSFQDGLEAFQRGWVELSDSGVIYGNGGVPHMMLVVGLTAEGHAALDAARAEAAARRPSARLRRACSATVRWIFRSVEHVILALLCSDMVLRWLIFFFKD